MKIKKSLVVGSFLSFLMVNVALAGDGPTCPSLNGSNVYSVDNYMGPWSAYYFLKKSPFDGGSIETTANNGEDARVIANAAFITINTSGEAHKLTWDDGRYFYVCSSSNGNYNTVSGTTRIFLSTPTYSPVNSAMNSQNSLAPVQPSLQEKYERFMLEQSKHRLNPFN